jgi:alpha-L-fucosidase
MEMFLHFGVNTYTDREWGLGNEDPNIFQPLKLDTSQWVRTAQLGGFKSMILVAKHHDGFMLFPTNYTTHSVVSSSWRGGKGDVAKDFTIACQAQGMQAAFYLSPWDRNFFNMTWKPAYNQFYENTLQVLTTAYGQFTEIWWDGANAVPNTTHLYDWTTWYKILNKNQPDAVGGGCGGEAGVRDCGPDTVWVGNEDGQGKLESWSFSSPSVEFPATDPTTLVWGGYFCDVSIRPGWFWHHEENDKLKTLAQLVDIYFNSVGRNCVLQLNVPPNQDGLIEAGDVQRVTEFGAYINQTFAKSFAYHGNATATSVMCGSSPSFAVDGLQDTFWLTDIGVSVASLTVKLLAPSKSNVVAIQEHIALGQYVNKYSVEIQVLNGSDWIQVANGTTIGYKKLDRFDAVMVSAVRLNILSTLYGINPAIELLGLYYAPAL